MPVYSTAARHTSSLTFPSALSSRPQGLTGPCVCTFIYRSTKETKEREHRPHKTKTHTHTHMHAPSQMSPTSKQASSHADGYRMAPSSNFSSSSSSSILPNSSSVPAPREHRLSDFAGYRRDLAVLEPAGSRAPQIVHQPPSTAASFMQQVAPWMTGGSAGASSNGNGNLNINTTNPTSSSSSSGAAANGAIGTTFFNDSSDNLSSASPSQMSPGFRSMSVNASRPTHNPAGSESPEAAYFNDERRPSIASVTTTASSQASKSSGQRGGLRKLQGFFGEEFPGRDSSETSLPPSLGGKESRSHSYSHTPRPHRDRNYSNATDHTRDASPSSSRPRTPVPAPEVVPFLYQEAEVRLAFPNLVCVLPTRALPRNRNPPANLNFPASPPPFLCRTLQAYGAEFINIHPSCWRPPPCISINHHRSSLAPPLTSISTGHRAIR